MFVVNSSEQKFLDYKIDGLIFSNFSEDVLYYLLYYLALLPQSTLRMSRDILSHYIETPPREWQAFPDLNVLLGGSS